MRCQVAAAVLPFHGRVRKCRTKPAGFMLLAPVAAAARLDDFRTGAAIIGTALDRHKCTFFPLAGGFTYQHFTNPP